MAKFNVGDRVRVVPNTADPMAYPNRARHGNVLALRDDMAEVVQPGVPPTQWYDVMLDSDLVRTQDVVTLPEHALEVGPR